MKKMMLSLAMLLCLTACSQEEEADPIIRGAESNASYQLTPSTQTSPSEAGNPEIGTYYTPAEAKEYPRLDGISVDYNFKEMSATIAYSQTLMMMYQPSDYWNKTMRIDGTYMSMETPEFGLVHLLLILDETNCCQGFVEFFLPEGATYPENGSGIGLVGVFMLIEDPQQSFSALVVTDYEI